MICVYPTTWLTFHTGVIYIALPSPCMPPSVHTESDHSVHTQTAFCQVSPLLFFSVRIWPLILTLKADLCMDFPLLHVSFTFLFTKRTIYITLFVLKSSYPGSEWDGFSFYCCEWMKELCFKREVLIIVQVIKVALRVNVKFKTFSEDLIKFLIMFLKRNGLHGRTSV